MINDTQEITYTDGLRQLADFLDTAREQRDDLKDFPTDSYGEHVYVTATVYGPWNSETRQSEIDVLETQRELAKWLDVMGPGTEKRYDDYHFTLTKSFGPHRLIVQASRQVVCKRVVVGVEEVPEQIIPATTKEITETVCAKISFKGILAADDDDA